ncbi:hypothetical protein GGGNBK_12450 [Sporosarcina sp. ANT_H38]
MEPTSKASIQIEQNPELSVYIWAAERSTDIIEGNELTVPITSGRYFYEVVSKWPNGEVSYTFVVEVK